MARSRSRSSSGNTHGTVEDWVVDAAKSGESTAWDAIVDRLSPSVWSAASQKLKQVEHIRDVYQLTWLLLADHLDQVEPGSIARWLAATAEREATRLALLVGQTEA